MWDHSAAENGGMQLASDGFNPISSKRASRKQGMSTLRLLLVVIVLLGFVAILLVSLLSRHKPGYDPEYGLKVGNMKGKMKGFPKIKRIIQRRGLAAHEDGEGHEQRGEDSHTGDAQTITKEMGIDQLQHAGFDPEAAAFEDGVDVEDLGYDEDPVWAGHTGHPDEGRTTGGAGVRHDAAHGGEVHDGRHIGARGAHTRNIENVHSGHRVGDDSVLHLGEDHFRVAHRHPHHEHGHSSHGSHGQAAHVGHGPGGGSTPPQPLEVAGGWKPHEGHEEDPHDREHKIKVRARLAEIFPLVDTNRDMHIDQAEMLAWHDENGKNASLRRAKREFTWADTNKDGQVAMAEYLADLLPEHFQGNETSAQIEASPVWKDPAHEWLLHNKASFVLADADRSGGLNEKEHFNFMHPEDGDNLALHTHLRQQDILDRDRDHDSKLDFDEFHDSMWYSLNEWENPDVTPETDDAVVSRARFNDLDSNKDGFLEADELAPVFHLLHPGEHEYARMQAIHQMEAADNSGDGKLTLNEMISNPYVFYGSSVLDEDADDTPVHDEF